ncbi:imidazolonepropionase [Natroniella sulfidigena]|uniref:imidazolonepropionase n=1 Tax=Natroniella sulfidigena TaxID=723921 RepID=UPI00200B02AF|nr:imidazolonepropionase [Natroniella sulfidigena]MCK8815824.1 imidazolonepropionase [Natroniella sulfidigena]
MKNVVVKNAGELITCQGQAPKTGSEMNELGIITDGAVVIKGGLITQVGKTDEILKNINIEEFEVIDAAGKPVLPGFIDSHTHFVFGGYRADEYSWRLQGVPYTEIMERGGGIINSVAGTREASFEELKESAWKRLDSMLSFGVTTTEGKSGYGLELETELKQLRVMKELQEEHKVDISPTFMGAHAIPSEYEGRSGEFIDYLIEEVMPLAVEEGGAEFCDIFCDQGVFTVDEARKLLLKGQELGLKAKIHADEIAQVGGAELAAELGAVSADHLLKASDEGIKLMAEEGVIGTLLPITAFSLKEPYARGRYMIDNGLPVALATDFNPGSCYSESIPLLIALSTLQMELTLEEVITALTINAAAAIDRDAKIGSIEVGKAGDLVILDAPSYTHLAYHIGVNIVDKVIKNGQLVVNG